MGDGVHEVRGEITQPRRERKQIEGWEERAQAGDGQEQRAEAGKALREKLSALEGELINLKLDTPQPGPNALKEKLATLAAMVDESDDAPTQGAHDVCDALSEQVAAQLAALRRLESEDVAAFNALVHELGLPAGRGAWAQPWVGAPTTGLRP